MLAHLEAASVGVPTLIRSIPERFFQNDPRIIISCAGAMERESGERLPIEHFFHEFTTPQISRSSFVDAFNTGVLLRATIRCC